MMGLSAYRRASTHPTALTDLKLGLLINFGSVRVKDEISRVVDGL